MITGIALQSQVGRYARDRIHDSNGEVHLLGRRYDTAGQGLPDTDDVHAEAGRNGDDTLVITGNFGNSGQRIGLVGTGR